MASSQRTELKSQSQLRFGCLIALLEELQIRERELEVPPCALTEASINGDGRDARTVA